MAGVALLATISFVLIRKPERAVKFDPKLEGLNLVDDSLDRTASTITE